MFECRDPYMAGGLASYPCGRCEPCLRKRRATWAHRIMLEKSQWQDSSFVTLTYEDEKLSLMRSGLATLEPKHLQDWLKRFRKQIAPVKIRFYAVGEYGDESFRPHYHVALFNFPSCRRGRTLRVPGSTRSDWSRCCDVCRLVGTTWGYGDVETGSLETSRAQYLARYVTKKMTRRQDWRLEGREPEFARMSNRPGLGHDAMWSIASELLKLDVLDAQPDVPSALRHGDRLWPVGRYLRQKLRAMVGREAQAPKEVIDAMEAEVLAVYEAARQADKNYLPKEALLEKGAQKVLNQNARAQIFKRRGAL